MLFLSLVWIALTAGLAWVWAGGRVWSVARRTGTTAQVASPLVVFGVGLGGENRPGPMFEARLNRALALQPGSVLILGGHTHPESPCSEAEAGRAWLEAKGVPAERIALEDRSVNTLENLYGVRAYMQERLRDGADVLPTLITSRFHLARSSMLATGLGIDHDLCAAEDRLSVTPGLLGRVAVEGFLVNWYVVGWWVSHRLGHEGMLSRIR